MRKGILLLVASLLTISIHAQNCNQTVSLPEDMEVCTSGELVSINGSTTGNVIGLRWSPTTGVFDTTAAVTTIQADQTTTYTLTAFSISDIDLITNGDFSSGDTGFTSDYRVQTGGGNLNEGEYAVARRPRDVHGGFARYNDHTDGNGNMLVVNASGITNNIWCQDITVSPGTGYLFSAWVASATSENPAELEFSINGQLLGESFKASGSTDWEPFSSLWIADQTTSAQICIVNVNNSPVGNDLTLDDIEFRELCEVSDDILIEVFDLNPSFTISPEFCQNESAVDLNSLLDPLATPGGDWTVNGEATDSFDPGSLPVGPHLVTYSLREGDCIEIENKTINVLAAPNPGTPVNDLLTFCADLDSIFQLDLLLDNEDPGGVWTLQDSPLPLSTITDLDGGMIQLTDPPSGTYTIRYSVSGTANCEPAFTEFQMLVNPLPTVNAGDDQVLLCESSIVTIGSADGQSAASINYAWQFEDGSIFSNASTTGVDQAGTYTLIATDANTGCTDQDDVIVSENTNQTTIEAAVDVGLPGCDEGETASILISNVKGGDEPYSYGLDGGPLRTDPEFINVDAGNHQVLIQDSNGCETTIDVEVASAEALRVNIFSQSDLEINAGDSIQLNAAINLPIEAIDSIVWEPALTNCNNCLNPVVAPISTTTYQITVYDQSGCSSTASKLVTVNEASLYFIPNVFSPNSDGVNDIFFVNTSAIVAKGLHFIIVDRWGNVVYSEEDFPTNDPNFGWDGIFDGKAASAGTYAYSVELELVDGSVRLEKGELQLLR